MPDIVPGPQLADSSDPQRAAIDHDKGPCLVLAAPGSGKTWVITQRFMRLVREGVPAENILCLTFTDRAGGEMLQRVEKEIGPVSGDPPLTTYHSWALRLLRDWGSKLGANYRDLRLATAAEQRMYLAEAMAEVAAKGGARTLYNPARPYDNVAEVSRVIERAKQELVTPQRYQAFARQLLTDATPEEREYAEQQKDIADVYAQLQKRYRESRLVDHDDCIMLAAELLRRSPAARNWCRQYQYVMVDEFQDTNTAQAVMVERMVGPRGNVLVVADDDQAIYRFRGASEENIRRFREVFPRHRELPLLENRRSTPQIIEAGQRVIENAASRQPKVVQPVRPDGERVRLITAAHYDDEAVAIVDVIKEKLEAGANFSDIAVLFGKNGDMTPVVRALRSAGIPYLTRGGREFFNAPEIMSVMRLLEAIADPDNNQAVLACLKFPEWGISEEARLAAIRQLRSDATPLIDLLRDGTVQGLSDSDRAAGQRASETIRALAVHAQTMDVRDLFEEAMLVSGHFGLNLLNRAIERRQVSRNLSKMAQIIDEFCKVDTPALQARIQRNGQLMECLKYLRLMDAAGEEGLADLGGDFDGVRLTTVHSAKGLEWPHVIVAACAEGKLPRRFQPNRIELPAAFGNSSLAPSEAHYQEELHLFYVAATRARDSVTFTWAKRYPGNNEKGMERKESRFLQLIPRELMDVREQPPTELRAAQPRSWAPPPSDGELALSFSALDSFKECQRQYEYRSIWGVPQVSGPESRFGTLMHDVLCDAMRLKVQGQPVDVRVVLDIFETKWRTEGNKLRVEAAQLYERGREMLRGYAASEHFTDAQVMMHQPRGADGEPSGNPVPMLEFKFKVDMGDGIALVGRFDRVDVRDGKPVVIDYKTGNPRSDASLRNDQQLKLYATAVMDITGANEVTCEIHWLKTTTISQVHFTRQQLQVSRRNTMEWCRKVKAAHFSGRQLPTNPSAWNCGHCPYRVICDKGREITGSNPLGI